MSVQAVSGASDVAAAILPRRGGFAGSLSDLLWRKPGLLLFLMLAPPLLWLASSTSAR